MKKKIGVMLAALVVVVGGVFYVQHKVQIEAMSTEVLVEELTLPLSLLTEEEITKIVIEDTHGLLLEKQNGSWKNPSEPDLSYNNELINEWVNYFQTEQSINIIRNVEDLSIYGITDHTQSIIISNGEGKSQTFRLGNINAEHTIRYIYSDETGLVYSVSPTKSEVLFVDSSKLISPEIKMPDLTKITQLSISQAGETLNLKREGENWYLTDYFKDDYEVKTEIAMGLIDALNALEKQSLYGKISEEENFNMDTPKFVITLDNKYALNVNSKSNGVWYFTENDMPYVYTITKDALKRFEDLKPLQIIHRQVYRPTFEDIESIVVTNPQIIYKLKLEEATVEDTKEATDKASEEIEKTEQEVISVNKTEQEDLTAEQVIDTEVDEMQHPTEEVSALEKELSSKLVSTLNDKKLDVLQTESILNLIEESVCIETVLQNPQIEQKTERKADISIAYYMKDGTQKLIELIPYDTNYYILRIDGNIEFAANKEKVTVLFSELGKMMKAAE